MNCTICAVIVISVCSKSLYRINQFASKQCSAATIIPNDSYLFHCLLQLLKEVNKKINSSETAYESSNLSWIGVTVCNWINVDNELKFAAKLFMHMWHIKLFSLELNLIEKVTK